MSVSKAFTEERLHDDKVPRRCPSPPPMETMPTHVSKRLRRTAPSPILPTLLTLPDDILLFIFRCLLVPWDVTLLTDVDPTSAEHLANVSPRLKVLYSHLCNDVIFAPLFAPTDLVSRPVGRCRFCHEEKRNSARFTTILRMCPSRVSQVKLGIYFDLMCVHDHDIDAIKESLSAVRSYVPHIKRLWFTDDKELHDHPFETLRSLSHLTSLIIKNATPSTLCALSHIPASLSVLKLFLSSEELPLMREYLQRQKHRLRDISLCFDYGSTLDNEYPRSANHAQLDISLPSHLLQTNTSATATTTERIVASLVSRLTLHTITHCTPLEFISVNEAKFIPHDCLYRPNLSVCDICPHTRQIVTLTPAQLDSVRCAGDLAHPPLIIVCRLRCSGKLPITDLLNRLQLMLPPPFVAHFTSSDVTGQYQNLQHAPNADASPVVPPPPRGVGHAVEVESPLAAARIIAVPFKEFMYPSGVLGPATNWHHLRHLILTLESAPTLPPSSKFASPTVKRERHHLGYARMQHAVLSRLQPVLYAARHELASLTITMHLDEQRHSVYHPHLLSKAMDVLPPPPRTALSTAAAVARATGGRLQLSASCLRREFVLLVQSACDIRLLCVGSVYVVQLVVSMLWGSLLATIPSLRVLHVQHLVYSSRLFEPPERPTAELNCSQFLPVVVAPVDFLAVLPSVLDGIAHYCRSLRVLVVRNVRRDVRILDEGFKLPETVSVPMDSALVEDYRGLYDMLLQRGQLVVEKFRRHRQSVDVTTLVQALQLWTQKRTVEKGMMMMPP